MPREYCTNICHQIFVILEVHFHEGGLSKGCYFELFYSTGSLYSPCKISSSTEAPFFLFMSFLKLLTNFVFSIFFYLFYVQNLGHCRAKQTFFRSVVSKMDEKQAVTFALFFYISESPKDHLKGRVSLNFFILS